jgi:4-aminobutyrate aminotransferase
VMSWPPGTHASTFGGNPVSCAASLATLKLLRDSLVENSRVVGAHLMAGAKELMAKHRIVGDVRGRGLMIGVELVRDRETKERATSERDAVVKECFKRGLLVLGAGRNAIRLSPPLVLTKGQADTALEILGEALGAVEKGRRKIRGMSWARWARISLAGSSGGVGTSFFPGATVRGTEKLISWRVTGRQSSS